MISLLLALKYISLDLAFGGTYFAISDMVELIAAVFSDDAVICARLRDGKVCKRSSRSHHDLRHHVQISRICIEHGFLYSPRVIQVWYTNQDPGF